MKREYVIILSAVAVGASAALGVGIASQVLLDQSLEIGVSGGIQAGLIAGFVFLGADYTRRQALSQDRKNSDN